MNWNKIPSLASLRAFEATARLGGFSAAARSLNVTHAAIAQHVRALEAFFSTDLVFRAGRNVEVSDAGRRLAGCLSEGFGVIESGVSDLATTADSGALQITLTPTFAENWLMPRLGEFWAAHPDIELVLKPGTRLFDLRRDGIDLAIRYGSGDWLGCDSELLTSTRVAVVGNPSLWSGKPLPKQSELQNYPWLRESLVDEHRLWADSLGIDFSKTRIGLFDSNNLVLSALRSGYGLSVQAAALVERDLAEGTLVSLLETQNEDLGYHLVTQKSRRSKKLDTFIGWLRRAV